MIVTAILAALAASGDGRDTIGIQAHSVNDARLMRQLYRKGVRSFKVDFHWVFENGEVCTGNNGSCFVLTHDDPVGGVDYDTSDTLLSAVDEVGPSGVRITLCMKPETPPAQLCSDTPFNRAWAAALDALVEKVNSSATLRQAVWTFDGGMAHPLSCYAQRWRPWGVTFVDGRSPILAKTSNDASKGYDRYTVLNDGAHPDTWKMLATSLVHYGKFRAGSQPYQLWEPDSQEELTDYADIYLNGRAGTHSPGFDFAINTDPALLRVYLGGRTRAAWNAQLSADAYVNGAVSLGGYSFGFVTGGSLWNFVNGSGLDAEPRVSAGAPLQSAGEGFEAIAPVGGRQFVGLNKTCGSVKYSVDESGEVTVVSEGATIDPRIPAGAQCLALSNSVVLTREEDCGGVKVYEPALVHCIPAPSRSTIVSAGVVTGEGGEAIIFFATNMSDVYASAGAKTTRIGVGKEVKLTESGGGMSAGGVVVLAVGGGFCYDAHSHRTSAKLKFCDQTPVAQSSTLTYTIAPFSVLLQRAASGNLTLTSCDAEVNHGTFSQGSNPVPVLLDEGKALSVVHKGYDGSGDGGCGTPLTHDGLVVDAFPVGGWTWGG